MPTPVSEAPSIAPVHQAATSLMASKTLRGVLSTLKEVVNEALLGLSVFIEVSLFGRHHCRLQCVDARGNTALDRTVKSFELALRRSGELDHEGHGCP